MLTSTATNVLRTNGVARPVTILLRSGAVCTSSSPSLVPRPLSKPVATVTSRRCLHTRPLSAATGKPIIISTLQVQCRHASTTRSDAQTDADAAMAAAAAQVAAHPGQALLDWNTFFQLRKTRRRLQQVFSVVGALSGGVGGATFLSTGAAESLVGKLPLDPFVALGLMTFSFSALGWLVGPVIGTAVFNVFKRKYKEQMAVKEGQFFARIKKHRVDPTSSSMNNPVPDFYGEKISSVAGYRQWLKDQRAYIKKRSTPFIQ
ncbi:hypothetical protein OQA88_1716 [Cercophora sp. LCS_1]